MKRFIWDKGKNGNNSHVVTDLLTLLIFLSVAWEQSTLFNDTDADNAVAYESVYIAAVSDRPTAINVVQSFTSFNNTFDESKMWSTAITNRNVGHEQVEGRFE